METCCLPIASLRSLRRRMWTRYQVCVKRPGWISDVREVILMLTAFAALAQLS